MSTNIVIKTDGESNNYQNIEKVMVSDDIGSVDWVEESKCKTTFKKITKNGRYVASERDNVIGYSAVFVNVPLNKIIGIDRTDGKTYKVYINAEGYIVKNEVE